MGHYLSDFETSEEHHARVVLQPMRDDLRVYDQEVKRGLVHTVKYAEKMEEHRQTLRDKGWDV